MITARVIIAATGTDDPEVWRQMLREELPVKGSPVACPECPLRKGGEWEAVAKRVAAKAPELEGEAHRFGCHKHKDRPCAGIRRIFAIPDSVTCPVCMYDPGELTDPLGLCRKHRRQLEQLKEQNHHGRELPQR